MQTVKLVAGTDFTEGVEVEIEINTFGNEEMLHFIKEALSNYVSNDLTAEINNLDFVEEVTTFDIPEDEPRSNYHKLKFSDIKNQPI